MKKLWLVGMAVFLPFNLQAWDNLKDNPEGESRQISPHVLQIEPDTSSHPSRPQSPEIVVEIIPLPKCNKPSVFRKEEVPLFKQFLKHQHEIISANRLKEIKFTTDELDTKIESIEQTIRQSEIIKEATEETIRESCKIKEEIEKAIKNSKEYKEEISANALEELKENKISIENTIKNSMNNKMLMETGLIKSFINRAEIQKMKKDLIKEKTSIKRKKETK